MVNDYEKYIQSLPVMPELAAKILSMTEERLDISFRELEKLISTDAALTTKILKIANSALYARPQEIKSLQMAITMLGFKNIRSLVLLVTASQSYAQLSRQPFYQFFWNHSVLTAFCARHVAGRVGHKGIAEDCFTAGLLHDIGQVALFNSSPPRYQPVLDVLTAGAEPAEPAEEKAFGVHHRTVGGALLARWSFPQVYVDAAREHESDSVSSPHRSLVLCVSVADLLSEKLRVTTLGTGKETLLRELAARAGLHAADLEYYRTRFSIDLDKDPLFRESRTLFALKD
jgi:putative nucleotidyltransferase with HDIG domain